MKIKNKKIIKINQRILVFTIIFVLIFGYIPAPKITLAATQNISFTTAGNYTYDSNAIGVTGGQASLGRSPDWWSTDYLYRKKITVTADASVAITTDNTITYNGDISALVSASKMQADHDDLRIVYWNGSANTEIDRDYLAEELAASPSDNTVRFKAQAAITAGSSDDGYYLYYNNDGAANPPEDYSNVYEYYEDFASDPSWTVIGTDCSSRISVSDGRLKKTGSGPASTNCFIADQTATMDVSRYDYYVEVTAKRTSATTDLVSFGLYDNVDEGDSDIGAWWWSSKPDTDVVTLYSGFGTGPWGGETIAVSQNVDTRHTQFFDVQMTWRPTVGDDVGWLKITGYLDGKQGVQQLTEHESNCANRAYPTVQTWDDAEAEWDDVKSWKGLSETAVAGSEETTYPNDNPVITNNTAISFDVLSGFTETATKNGGEIKYILSNDNGTIWYYYSSSWTTSNGSYSQANTAAEINTNASSFTAGSGELKVRTFLHSDGSQLVQLNNLTITLNNYPEATFDNDYGAWQSGNITANYKLIDLDSDTLNISQAASSGLEYSTDGSAWSDATMTTGGDGLTGLNSATSPGEDHSFIWDSRADLADTEDASVYLRIRPNDGNNNANSWLSSDSFGLDNKAPADISAPTFNALTTSSIVINKPASITEDGSGLSTWQVRRNNDDVLNAVSNSAGSVTDTPLSPNTQYAYGVRFTDAEGNISAYGSDESIYTLANVPDRPALASTSTSVIVTLDKSNNPEGTGNSADTEYAIFETTTDKYVQEDGTLGDNIAWQTYTNWGRSAGQEITTVDINVNYTFKVKAKNGDGIATNYSSVNTIKFEGHYLAPPTIVSPANNSLARKARPIITGLARSNNTIFIFVDGELENTVLSTDHSSGTGSFYYHLRRDLTNGEHSLYTIARDSEGIYSDPSPVYTFTVEIPYITPTLYSPVYTSGSNPALIIQGVAYNDSLIKVYLDDGYLTEFMVINNQAHESTYFSYKFPLVDLSAGTHTIYTKALDFFGKESNFSNKMTFGKSPLENKSYVTTYQFEDEIGYTIVSGDSLWEIAEQFYGDGAEYTKIVNANEGKYPSLSLNPGVIQVGWHLSIP